MCGIVRVHFVETENSIVRWQNGAAAIPNTVPTPCSLRTRRMMSAPDIDSSANAGFGKTSKAALGFWIMTGPHGNAPTFSAPDLTDVLELSREIGLFNKSIASRRRVPYKG